MHSLRDKETYEGDALLDPGLPRVVGRQSHGEIRTKIDRWRERCCRKSSGHQHRVDVIGKQVGEAAYGDASVGRESPIGNPKTNSSRLIEIEDNSIHNEQVDTCSLKENRTSSWTGLCFKNWFDNNMTGSRTGSCNQIWSANNDESRKVVDWIFYNGATNIVSYDPNDFSNLSLPSKSHIETVSG